MTMIIDGYCTNGGKLPWGLVRWLPREIAILFIGVAIGSCVAESWAASSQPKSPSIAQVDVFTSADETSPLIETLNDGVSLMPMAEMMGAGGTKWFMVKTPAGNLGWIKAGENSAARQVDGHFRALPKETVSFSPTNNSSEATSKVSTQGKVTIPVQMRGRHAIVAVTFNDTVSGNLVLDTGAGQTMISKRIANDLRLYSSGGGTRIGIGGAVTVSTATIDSVRVGDADVKNMRVTIHDLPFNAFEEGLLGMDFLGRFQMSLDMEKRVLILAPRRG